MARFEDKLTEKIYDNVHGFIYLTKEEKELLSTPYFQRLNHIKQLGLSYFVFPGAVHTRFSHSLGVLYITEKLIQRLKKIKYKAFKEPNSKYHKIARLSALLHDIGHYPLSHTIESSYRECSRYLENIDARNIKCARYIENEERSEQEENNGCSVDIIEQFKKRMISGEFQDFFFYDESIEKLQKYHHENMARTVINSPKFKEILIKKFKLDDNDIDLICSIIDGTNVNEDFFIISRLIKSNFDADQMDYMLRDTKNTGINVTIDLEFIIDNLYVKRKQHGALGYKKFICFHGKALPSIEQFLLAKYYWYSNILYYDKVYIIDYIARRLFSYLLLSDSEMKFSTLGQIEDSLKNPEEFFFFNDSLFWNAINKIINNKRDYPKLIFQLAEMFINRDFPKLLNEKQFYEKLNKEFSLIKFSPTVKLEDEALNIEIKDCRMKFSTNKKSKLLFVPIDREIIKIPKDFIGESELMDEKVLEKEEIILRDFRSYLKSEDIYITSNLKNCKNITDGNQFLSLFLEKEKPKKLYIFRIYDFQKCMKN